MSRYRYEIDNQNTLRVWDDENPNELNAPFLLQPDWPSAVPWANKNEVEDWAKVFIESLENPESEFVPGESPDNHPKPRPAPEPEETLEES
jgi:hypothetical protein